MLGLYVQILRKLGDLILIYVLPYFIWKLVPTFDNSQINQRLNDLYQINFKALTIIIFLIILLLVTSLEFILLGQIKPICGGFQAFRLTWYYIQ